MSHIQRPLLAQHVSLGTMSEAFLHAKVKHTSYMANQSELHHVICYQ
jgi:hypothetical protein